jgi:hypothetical protein
VMYVCMNTWAYYTRSCSSPRKEQGSTEPLCHRLCIYLSVQPLYASIFVICSINCHRCPRRNWRERDSMLISLSSSLVTMFIYMCACVLHGCVYSLCKRVCVRTQNRLHAHLCVCVCAGVCVSCMSYSSVSRFGCAWGYLIFVCLHIYASCMHITSLCPCMRAPVVSAVTLYAVVLVVDALIVLISLSAFVQMPQLKQHRY